MLSILTCCSSDFHTDSAIGGMLREGRAEIRSGLDQVRGPVAYFSRSFLDGQIQCLLLLLESAKKGNKKYYSAVLKVISFFWRLKVKSINVNEKSTSTHTAAVTEFSFVTFMKNCLKR